MSESAWNDGMDERDQFRLLVKQHDKATTWLHRALTNGQGVVSTRIVLDMLTEWPDDFAPATARYPSSAEDATTERTMGT